MKKDEIFFFACSSSVKAINNQSIKMDFAVFYLCFWFDFIREKLVEEFFRNPTGPMVSVKVP